MQRQVARPSQTMNYHGPKGNPTTCGRSPRTSARQAVRVCVTIWRRTNCGQPFYRWVPIPSNDARTRFGHAHLRGSKPPSHRAGGCARLPRNNGTPVDQRSWRQPCARHLRCLTAIVFNVSYYWTTFRVCTYCWMACLEASYPLPL